MEKKPEIQTGKQLVPAVPTEQAEAPKRFKRQMMTIVQEYLEKTYDFRYDIILNEIEFKPLNSTIWKIFKKENLIVELAKTKMKLSDSKLNSLITSDFVQEHNPLKHYFEHLPAWQPKKDANGNLENDYIKQLSTFVKAKDTERFTKHFEKMLVRMIACALNKDFNKQAFILIGNQNDGKTSFLRFLCPPQLKSYFAENINPDDKDGYITLSQNFIINLDELANLDKKDTNKIKSLMSVEVVNARKPYGTRVERMARVANFVGSTNEDTFLTDATGSVRWLCFEIDSIDFAYSSVNIDLVYSQAYALYKEGFEYKLTKEDIAENEDANAYYQKITNEMELIQEWYEEDTECNKTNFRTSTEIFTELQALTSIKLNSNNIGKTLKQMKIPRKIKKEGKIPKYGYFLHKIK